MTHDDDLIRLKTVLRGFVDFTLKSQGLEWPPPKYLYLDTDGRFVEAEKHVDPYFVFIRTSMSELSYEQASHPNLIRGASYQYLTEKQLREWAQSRSESSGAESHTHVTSSHGSSSEESG